MDKIKRIFALLGVVLILGLFVFLVVAASNAGSNFDAFNAAMVAVVLVPTLLWIYLYIFKLMKKREQNDFFEEENDK